MSEVSRGGLAVGKTKYIEKLALRVSRCWTCDRQIFEGDYFFAPEKKAEPRICVQCRGEGRG